MTAAIVVGLPVRWEWVPVEHCDSCAEARPVDHRTYLLRLEAAR